MAPRYQVELQGFWDDRTKADLRVFVNVDDGGWLRSLRCQAASSGRQMAPSSASRELGWGLCSGMSPQHSERYNRRVTRAPSYGLRRLRLCAESKPPTT